jgi:hypothetical protein
MSGAEREQGDGLEHAAGEPHMHDYEGHVRAVEADLEYYRVKRFEPRVFSMARRGIVTLYDLVQVGARLESSTELAHLPAGPPRDLASRIRALEDGLDDYVRGIALLQSNLVKGVDIVIEDTRKERGDYDEFFEAQRHGSHNAPVQGRRDGAGAGGSPWRKPAHAVVHPREDRGRGGAARCDRQSDRPSRPLSVPLHCHVRNRHGVRAARYREALSRRARGVAHAGLTPGV